MGTQEMEKSIGEADAKVTALKAQQAELDSQAGAIRQHCEELRQEQEEEGAAVARLTDSKCQVTHLDLCQEQTALLSGAHACTVGGMSPFGSKTDRECLVDHRCGPAAPFPLLGWVYRGTVVRGVGSLRSSILIESLGWRCLCRPGPSTEL